ncbi:MAG: hypothetical protein RJA10_2872, partial [Pseudomonadota bacterium]
MVTSPALSTFDETSSQAPRRASWR